MLNGQPSVIAKGEQVAVFNRHQQKAMNAMHPGGLRGFFARNNRPHYVATGRLFPSNAPLYADGGVSSRTLPKHALAGCRGAVSSVIPE